MCAILRNQVEYLKEKREKLLETIKKLGIFMKMSWMHCHLFRIHTGRWSLSEVWSWTITNDSGHAALVKKQRTGEFGRGVPVINWKSSWGNARVSQQRQHTWWGLT